jgi:hypothetical protein
MKAVYVMTREDGAVKVGASRRPEKRTTEVAGAIGQSVSVTFRTEPRADALAIENTAHKLLIKKQHEGEWFDVTAEDAREAIIRAISIMEGEEEDITEGVRFWRGRKSASSDPARRLSKHTTMRIKPHIKALAEKICAIEHRDLTNLCESVILEYARSRGISLDQEADAPKDAGPSE